MAPPAGTTSFLDTGSAGAITLAGMRRYVIEPARTRIRALVNICTAGLITTLGELRDPRYLDIDGTVRAIDANRDIAPGVKIRYSENIVGGGAQARAALDAAVEAASQAGVWLMVHIGYTPEPIPDVLARLRPGDVITHSYSPLAGGLVDLDARGVLPAVAEARAAGIEFDIGHGKSSFGWETAQTALDSGFPPDYISSDLHRGCVHGPAFNLPNVMTKFWLLGMPLQEIVARCTVAPAGKLGLECRHAARRRRGRHRGSDRRRGSRHARRLHRCGANLGPTAARRPHVSCGHPVGSRRCSGPPRNCPWNYRRGQ